MAYSVKIAEYAETFIIENVTSERVLRRIEDVAEMLGVSECGASVQSGLCGGAAAVPLSVPAPSRHAVHFVLPQR